MPDGPMDRVRDALGTWRGDARTGLALMVVVAVVAGVVWYRIGVGGSDVSPRRLSAPTTSGATRLGVSAASTTTTGRDVIVVHVAGAVSTPGVVELEAGARVIDAIEAAGGAVSEADLDRLNLAAKLSDGERVLVQRIGDPAAPVAPSGGGSAGSSSDSGTTEGLLDLNTATSDELEALPGIGPALAAAIIDERERRGGFKSVQELRDVRGIGEKRFADLADHVTV